MTTPIILLCEMCQREQEYPRAAALDVPDAVATIVSSGCDRCDDGDFGPEQWLDADGQEVPQV